MCRRGHVQGGVDDGVEPPFSILGRPDACQADIVTLIKASPRIRIALTKGGARGKLASNPCERGGRRYRADRSECVWSDADIARFLAVASAPLRLALILALWTGQRQGDLLRLPWSAYDGATIRLRQSKTGRRVGIKAGEPLRLALADAPRRATTILTNSDGHSWTEDGFRTSWGKACARAGVVGVRFHDLRGSAVSRLAEAGCTEAEIAAITGHSLRHVGTMLDRYLHRSEKLAEAAILKLERTN